MDNYIVGSVANCISRNKNEFKKKDEWKNSRKNKKGVKDNEANRNSEETNSMNCYVGLKSKKTVLKRKNLVEENSSNVFRDIEPEFKKQKQEVPDLEYSSSNSIKKSPTKNLKNHRRDINLKKKQSNNNSSENFHYNDFTENTIFVGNVPIDYNKQKLCKLFSKFGKIQTVRIRCVPIADVNMSKKVAAIKKKFNPNRNSLVAYIKFMSQDAVNAALKANGMVIEGHHIRIDIADENKEKDNNKAVFVGCLPFNTEDDELWEFFQNCGKINSVRIIRDSQTSMGKGFGYVNFDSTASVELALQMDGQTFKNRTINIKRCIKGRNKNKLNVFGKRQSKEVTNQLLAKSSQKLKIEKKKMKEKPLTNDFHGKIANLKEKKKKRLSKAELQKKKVIKILGVH